MLPHILHVEKKLHTEGFGFLLKEGGVEMKGLQRLESFLNDQSSVSNTTSSAINYQSLYVAST